MTALRLAALVLLAACSGSTSPLGGPCQRSCDCARTDAPLGCAGEWACNADKVCEFSCTPSCGGGGVSTCAGDQRCNGTKCTARSTCP
jgi:hypothetical protein